MHKSTRRPVAKREGPIQIAPVLHQFDRDIFDVPIDRARSWLEEMLAIYGTTDSIVHCFWPISRRDDDWLVAELCFGFLNESAEFDGDVALTLVDEAATFLAKT